MAADQDIRCDIVEAGRRLYARGLISANEGNISVREGDALYVTPAGVCKGFLHPSQIVVTDLEGKPKAGGRATTEILMHVAVYRRRPDVVSVVHAHPPMATAFAVAGIPLDQPLIAEAVVTLGAVPVIPYGMPSTDQLARNVGEAVCQSHALLMANHGALAMGDSLWRAWERMETLEQLARISLYTRLLGGPQPLPAGDVDRLRDMRTAAGYPPPVCGVSTPATSLPGAGSGDDRVVLSRTELVALIADAVKKFNGSQF